MLVGFIDNWDTQLHAWTASLGWRSKWNTSRWAVLGPMPGKDANASTARETGSIVCT